MGREKLQATAKSRLKEWENLLVWHLEVSVCHRHVADSDLELGASGDQLISV